LDNTMFYNKNVGIGAITFKSEVGETLNKDTLRIIFSNCVTT